MPVEHFSKPRNFRPRCGLRYLGTLPLTQLHIDLIFMHLILTISQRPKPPGDAFNKHSRFHFLRPIALT